MNEQQLMAQRQNLLKQIQAKGGKNNAPNLSKQLQALDVQLKGMRKAQGAGTQTAGTQPAGTQSPNYTGKDLGVDNRGGVNSNKAVPTVTDAAASDINKTFGMNNPGTVTDEFGNVRNISYDPNTGQTAVSTTPGANLSAANSAFLGTIGNWNDTTGGGKFDLSGAPKILQTGDIRQEAERAGQANYDFLTKNYARDKARELELAKSEMDVRGIPYNPQGESLWGKTTGAINERYQSMDTDAKNQALATTNQTLSSWLTGQSAANQAFINQALTQYNAPLNAGASLTGMANSYSPNMPAYAGGVSNMSPVLISLLNQIAGANYNKYSAGLRNSGSGGGSASAETPFILGGDLV